ncbi:hypothetical protein CKA32_005483 [Geitlerinema sp. FC II]|nr:hypothetical protein CKA32_005483 [Geitlerinema sp. FC II]
MRSHRRSDSVVGGNDRLREYRKRGSDRAENGDRGNTDESAKHDRDASKRQWEVDILTALEGR